MTLMPEFASEVLCEGLRAQEVSLVLLSLMLPEGGTVWGLVSHFLEGWPLTSRSRRTRTSSACEELPLPLIGRASRVVKIPSSFSHLLNTDVLGTFCHAGSIYDPEANFSPQACIAFVLLSTKFVQMLN